MMLTRSEADVATVAGSMLGAMGAGGGGNVDDVRSFWRRVERFAPGAQVLPDAPSDTQLVIISGWACDLRILPDGRRQIFSFLIPGDVIHARGAGSVGWRGVVALTHLEVINFERQVAAADPVQREVLLLARATAALLTEERLYDHLVRMGRLTARERVIHLLLELRERLQRADLLKGDTFKIPLTQEIFADALGLSVVHINRTLKQLRREGSVSVKAGVVTLQNPEKLAIEACYVSPHSRPAERAEFGVEMSHGRV